MRSHVALVADTESQRRPSMIGLAGENLGAQSWLTLYTSAQQARLGLRDDMSADEVWVASSDDMDPINLAAALKRDRIERAVYLLAFQGTGSLRSRASSAGIDATLSQQAFAERYAQQKHRHTGVRPHAASAPSSAALPPVRQRAERPTRPVTPLPSGQPTAASAFDPRTLKGADAIAAAKSAFVMPVVSGSGGAGKSTVAALAGMLAQGLGYETLLIDADLQFGDLPSLLGAADSLAIDEALSAPGRLAQLKGDGLRPALLAAPARLEHAEMVVNELPHLLGVLKSRFDVIIANTGACWADEHALLLEQSSKALFLVDQRSSSLRACQHALDLCARCGIATSPFLFVANRCAKGALFTSIDVSCALRGAHVVELADGGRDVEELLGAGMPLDLLAARNDLCTSLEGMLLDVLPDGGTTVRPRRQAPPAAERKRFRMSRKARRRSAACL